MRADTTTVDKDRIDAFYRRIQEGMLNLHARWQEEKEYEDFNDYENVFRTWIPKGFALIKATKRPFGFTFQVGTDAVYSITCSSKTYSWGRIK